MGFTRSEILVKQRKGLAPSVFFYTLVLFNLNISLYGLF